MRIVFTLESQPEQVLGSMAGNSEEEMARWLKLDLARLKDFIESRGQAAAQGNAPKPVASSARAAAEQRNDSAGSSAASVSHPPSSQ